MVDSINVATGFDEKLLMRLFTTDISAEECIYDLIDNSIDAAREKIQSENYEEDEFGLPKSYKGFKIDLTIDSAEIILSDNCRGVSRSEFENSTFIIGEQSSSDYSIGFYGIGLKRALLKLGSTYKIKSDDGNDEIQFNAERKTLSQSKVTAMADVAKSKGVPSFSVKITNLDSAIQSIVQDKTWMNELRDNISRRYGIFLGKGLVLKIAGKILKGRVPKVRGKGPIASKKDTIDTVSGVAIHVHTGSHPKYKMKHENGYSLAQNKKLTEEFGWYIICNDRIMIVGNKTKEFGLTSNWHTEYNGFVGCIFFVAKDASELPWNTKKTEIVKEAPSFMKVKGLLQDYTDDWKKANKEARPKKPKPVKGPTGPSVSPRGSAPKAGKTGSGKPASAPNPTPPLISPAKIETLEPNADIYAELKALNNGKLTSLYYSITSVKLENNTPLIAVGAWAFLESLSALAGRYGGASFHSFWSLHWASTNGIPSSDSNKSYKGIYNALERLQDAGNITKHDVKAATYDSNQLNNDLIVIEHVIRKSISIASKTG